MVASPEEPGVVEIFWHIAMVLWLWGGISTFGSFADMNFDFFRKERVVWVKIEPLIVLEFITYIFYSLCLSAWHDLEKYIPIFNIMHRLKYLKCIIVRPMCEFVPINYVLFSTNGLFCGFCLKSRKYISDTRLAMSRILVPRTHRNGTAFLMRLVDSWSWLEPAHTEAVQPPPLHAVCNGHWGPHVGGLSPSKHTTRPIPAFLCVGLSPRAGQSQSHAGCDVCPYLKNTLVLSLQPWCFHSLTCLSMRVYSVPVFFQVSRNMSERRWPWQSY